MERRQKNIVINIGHLVDKIEIKTDNPDVVHFNNVKDVIVEELERTLSAVLDETGKMSQPLDSFYTGDINHPVYFSQQKRLLEKSIKTKRGMFLMGIKFLFYSLRYNEFNVDVWGLLKSHPLVRRL